MTRVALSRMIYTIGADWNTIKTRTCSCLEVFILPVFLTPLIGREHELETLEQLLRHAGVRLITLTGPGGVGKTRLAVAAAERRADDYPAAMSYVSLVPVKTPNEVLPAITAALGIQDGENDGGAPSERIIRFIHEKEFLLVIDNFEHVIEAAYALPDLLAACPNLKIIATSRQLLRVRAEQEFAVPLLALPDMERFSSDVDLVSVLPRYSAVNLFLERMRAIYANYEPDQADLRAIAAICVRLDGLPLAIELAAPRTRMFKPEQLLHQLSIAETDSSLKLLAGGARDLPARQRTLSRTIRWSYNLLSAGEQRAYRAASTFTDTFSLNEAKKIFESFSDGQDDRAASDVIESLLEKNMLVLAASPAEPRFRMLVMLQEFGRVEAGRLGETPTLNAIHAAAFLELAEESVPKLYSRAQIETTARLRRDVGNIRMALHWALNEEKVEIAARFGVALWRFWLLAGLLSEGQIWLKQILGRLGYNPDGAEKEVELPDLTGLQPSDIGRIADLLYGLGNLGYHRSGSRREVIQWLSQSRELYVRIDDQARAAFAMTALARAMLFEHTNLNASQELLEEGFKILHAAGHKIGVAENLSVQARHYFYADQPEKADRAMQKSLVLLRETGNIYELAHATQFAADLAFGRVGGYEQVRRHYSEAAEMFTALGNLTEAAVVKAMIDTLNGVIAGDWKGALASVEEANRISREHSNERAVALCAAIAAWVYGNLGDYVKGRHAALEAMHSAYLISYHLGLRSAFIGLANIERLEGDYAAAVSTISAMMSYRLRHNTLASSRGNSLHVTSFRQIKRKLEPATFAEAWTAGPAKLVELLGQPDSDRESWPLAPVPKMDTLETPEQAGVETSLDSRDADTSSIFPEPLTEREKEVLAFLVQGMTDPQIAEVLVVSPRTIHAHLRNIYAKMGVNTRSAATRLAIEHNLI